MTDHRPTRNKLINHLAESLFGCYTAWALAITVQPPGLIPLCDRVTVTLMDTNTPKTHPIMVLLATGFGSGYAPVAPGTAGSVVGVLLAWPLLSLPTWGFLLATAACFLLGISVSGAAESHFAAKDPGAIVIDEIAGVWITLIAVTPTPLHLLLGFALFRLFDITKPFPCKWAERRFTGGLGVMADDVFAGIYAALVLQLLIHFTGL